MPEQTWKVSTKPVVTLEYARGSNYVYGLTEDEVSVCVIMLGESVCVIMLGESVYVIMLGESVCVIMLGKSVCIIMLGESISTSFSLLSMIVGVSCSSRRVFQLYRLQFLCDGRR